MKKVFLSVMLLLAASSSFAQRQTDKLDRGLVAMKVSGGVYLSWRILGEEYYDVKYNVYRDGVQINDTPLSVSNFKDTAGSATSTYTVKAVVRGQEQAASKSATTWESSYKEIKLKHEGIKSTLIPNDACCADVDGDGEIEILMKFDNASEANAGYPRDGYNGEYSIFECLKQDGTRLWWVNCGPNMGDFQNNEQNIVAYDWDGDGCAEAVMRATDGTVIHMADGTTYTVGNPSVNVRNATNGGVNWFVVTNSEYLVYLDGKTGKPYQCIKYPLPLLEEGETDYNKAWGISKYDNGHRGSKHFFGAPYLDGKKPSIFLARGIYTRHKMIALDVDPATHTLVERWRWNNNSNGPWKGQGYHNFCIADVDLDGRDEIVYGSMVIDDNGKGLSTTGLGHGDSQHCSDFNPYIHGLEIYACNEDDPGNNYRDATTSKIYHRFKSSSDDGRAICGNFTNSFPGSLGCSAKEGAISTVTNNAVPGMDATGVCTNFRIYWDGDLCSETFNYVNGKNTEGAVIKYGSWTPIYTCAGSLTNNDTKGTPCYQGDILGDWREEIIMRTADNNIRIYSTPTQTKYRNYTLWHDHQYRNSMVWQMCGYNQTPHTSYFLGQLENITIAPPPLTTSGRTEVANGGTISKSLDSKHVLVFDNDNTNISIEDGAKPYIVTFNVPTWVQGSAPSEATASSYKISYTTYTCNVTGGGLDGEARLIKQGDGVLNLPKANFKHTGETNIWAGTLNFDGTMTNSPLWLNRFAELNSNGGTFRSIKADYASVIRPGGEDSMGNITTDSLYLGFGSRIAIDLYSDGLNADKINTKYLKVEKKTGTAWTTAGPKYLAPVIELTGHKADGENTMASGKYVLGEVDKIEGDVNDIIIEGLATTKKALYVEDGKLVLEIYGLRNAAQVTWTGNVGNVWNFAGDENFTIMNNDVAEATTFVYSDDVLFNDEAAQKTVNIDEEVIPNSFTVSNTAGYVFNGNGSIGGAASFTKEGTGMVTINNSNSYTGGNHLKGGVTKVSKLSNQYSETGNLGGITKTADKFTMENGAVLQTSATVEMGSLMKMVGEDGGVINASADFVMDALISGTTLTKKGSGCLKTQKANTGLGRLVINGGSVAAQAGDPAKVVEIQNGTLWDDAQATTHEINVPSGKSGTWQLTGVYYTAYKNKLTGGGTLTIVPRNTVQRVRLQGNWSAFTGTIKHVTKNICLPLDATTGLANGTLDIADGCSVSNVCKTFKIGKLTGKGSLLHPVANFQNSSAVKGSNTWQVGNSKEIGGDFTFDGAMHDEGGSNKCNFDKIGSCKMTVSGEWTNSGTVKVSGGELFMKSGATLGSGSLTVNAGAKLSGTTKAGKPMTNSSFTINGEIHPGSYATAVTGNINFNGKNVTFGAASRIVVGLRKSAASASAPGNSYLTNIGTLKLTAGATVAPFISEANMDNLTKDENTPDIFYVWTDAKTVNITGTLNFDLPQLPSYNYWDTSDIAKGILYVKCDAEKYQEFITGINGIDADEVVNVTVTNMNGVSVMTFTCPMGSVMSTAKHSTLANGIYMLNAKTADGKTKTIKMLK